MLYICGTPLGNLEDITLRVLRLLKEVDCIAAEDTRHTLKLLNFYDIKKPLISFHEHNQKAKAPDLLRQLSQGQNIALVSDAGMPCISDPGQYLIKLCHENGIAVTAAPGPTAAMTALALSGCEAARFTFEGFLPRDNTKRKAILETIRGQRRAVVFYEAPHHLRELLLDLHAYAGNRRVALARELTKLHEEILHDSLENLIRHFEAVEPRGEFVLILEAEPPFESALPDVRAHVESYEKQGWDKKEAMKLAARDRGVGKREIYRALLDFAKE
jgi:16S rRNA (cytidine1402-2'-O)-methyltransferase